jgi:hypothetical protein
LEREIRDAILPDAASGIMDLFVHATLWKSVHKLIETLKKSRTQFVAMITNPVQGDYVLETLSSWGAAFSHTQPVEKTFLDWDHQARGDSGGKRKATEPSGKVASHVTRMSRVLVAGVWHESE